MKKIITILLLLVLTGTLAANNIAISNLSLTDKNTTDHFTMVQFDISWENSWRTSSAPNNWDAAWVFVKYRKAGGEWNHAWLNENGHTTPAGSIIMPGLVDPGSAFNARHRHLYQHGCAAPLELWRQWPYRCRCCRNKSFRHRNGVYAAGGFCCRERRE